MMRRREVLDGIHRARTAGTRAATTTWHCHVLAAIRTALTARNPRDTMKATLDDISFSKPDDAAGLADRAMRGDQQAISLLYSCYVPVLRSWLAWRVPACLAGDLAHDALVKALRHGSEFLPGRGFMPWLKAIAWRMAQNTLRNEARRRARESAYVDHAWQDADEEEDTRSQCRTALFKCLSRLPVPQRRLLHERYCDGQHIKAIASAHGRTSVAVAVNLHRICRRLRTDIERAMQACEPASTTSPARTSKTGLGTSRPSSQAINPNTPS